MKRPPVIARINPELLAWARRSGRFSIEIVAARLKVTPETIIAWERGEKNITITQLRRFAEVCKRPLAVFYLPEPPKDFDALRDFRRIADETGFDSPELAAEIRWAHQMRELALELFSPAGIDRPNFGLQASLQEKMTTVAARIRKATGISLDRQFDWKDGYAALAGWRNSLESLGVLCFQFSGVSVRQARGFSIHATSFPVVAVNAKDAPTARCFSLFHELTHVMLATGGTCELHETFHPGTEIEKIESFCNQVAGHVLVPRESLLQQPIVTAKNNYESWSDRELETLVRKFKVSEEVIILRLVAHNLATRDFYYQRKERYLGSLDPETGGGGDTYLNRTTKYGTSMILGIMSAYQDGIITANDASAYLGIQVKYLPRLLQTAIERIR